jgi:hypothetical protein
VDGTTGAGTNVPDDVNSRLSPQKRVTFNQCLSPTAIGRTFEFLVGTLLGILWLKSAFSHLANPYYFLGTIYRYELVGVESGRFLAILLPALQLVLGICLLGRQYVTATLLLSTVILMIFGSAQGMVLLRGLQIDCGCFGASQSMPVGGRSFGLAIGLLLLTIAALIVRNRTIYQARNNVA